MIPFMLCCVPMLTTEKVLNTKGTLLLKTEKAGSMYLKKFR